MAGERYMTTDHDRIREWAESRDARPSTVASTHKGDDPGLIRLDFPGYTGEEALETISWDDWVRKFDEGDLVLLFQETRAAGGRSSFNKLISRDTAEKNTSAEWVGGPGGERKGGRRKAA